MNLSSCTLAESRHRSNPNTDDLFVNGNGVMRFIVIILFVDVVTSGEYLSVLDIRRLMQDAGCVFVLRPFNVLLLLLTLVV